MPRKDLALRLDSIFNSSTGIGAGKDTDFGIAADKILTFAACRTLLRTSAYYKRAVGLPVDDMLRNGYNILEDGANEADPETMQAWEAEDRRLGIDAKVSLHAKWGRGMGAAYILMVTRDGRRPEQALDLSSLRSVDQLLVLDAEECVRDEVSALTGRGQRFDEPAYYRIQMAQATREKIKALPSKWAPALSGMGRVHHSRIIRVIGNDLTRLEKVNHWAEGDSLAQSMFRELAQATSLDNAAAVLASEMKQDVIRIPGLDLVSTSDAADAFDERMSALRTGKSLLNLIILGMDEEYSSGAANVSGFKDLSEQAQSALVAAHGIPKAVFYGESSGGLSGDAGVEADTYSSLLKVQWKSRQQSVYHRLFEVLRAQRDSAFGERTTGFKFQLRPLRESGPKDEVALRLTVAQLDSIYVGAGILPVEYIRERFKGADGWRMELPTYDEARWPPAPPEPSGGGGGGQNAPGQIPPDPTKLKVEAAGAKGVDNQTSIQNTGARKDDGHRQHLIDMIKTLEAELKNST